MKRPTPLALAALVLASTLSGCQGLEDFLDESSVSEKAFYAGAVVGGAPAVVAFAPLTIPLAATSESCHGGAAVFLPGVPTGLIGGVTLGLPVLLLETIVRLPGRLWRRDSEPDSPPSYTPDWLPAPVPEDESIYEGWPGAQSVVD